MPSVEWNLQSWGVAKQWGKAGDDWSDWWGGPEMHWRHTLWPRLAPYLPAGRILEIAPGFGRWTSRLKDHCQQMILVDLAPNCIDACRQRFAADSHIDYHVNDGRSLAMVPDGFADLVFSFDSLVHAEADVLQAYVQQLATKLAPQGVAFIHHSNVGEYQRYFAFTHALPMNRRLWKLGLIELNRGYRGTSMSAARLREFARSAGLVCVAQELVNWGTRRLIDCMSVITRPGSKWDRPLRVMRNGHFMTEASIARQLAELHGAAPASASRGAAGPTGAASAGVTAPRGATALSSVASPQCATAGAR